MVQTQLSAERFGNIGLWMVLLIWLIFLEHFWEKAVPAKDPQTKLSTKHWYA